MFILKNAWISITRNKGRNILIGVIILITACASTVTLAIKNTASDLINSYANAYEKQVTISFNRSNVMKDFDMSDETSREEAKNTFENIASYTVADVIEFANSEYVESFYYTYNISLDGNNIEAATSEFKNNMQNKGMGGKGNDMQISSSDFTLNGYSSIEAMEDFVNGTYTMTEITDNAWELAFSGNYVFINKELAEYNQLVLNDKIILQDENENTYEFEIIGIYEETEAGDSAISMSMFSNSANTIITNTEVLINIVNENSDINGTVNPTYIIDSYDNVEKLQQEFYEKGLDETYVLQTNEETAENAVSGVSSVNSFATIFLIITLVIGGTVLLIINMINIRERKYEIGVLRTIGISKTKLTMQFVSELLMVALVALLIGAGIGATMSKSVSNLLLASEIETSTEKTEEIANNFGGGKSQGGFGEMMEKGESKNISKMMGVPTIQAYDSIDAVVDITVVLQLLAVGLVLVLISSLAAMISIQRFSPLTILKERS